MPTIIVGINAATVESSLFTTPVFSPACVVAFSILALLVGCHACLFDASLLLKASPIFSSLSLAARLPSVIISISRAGSPTTRWVFFQVVPFARGGRLTCWGRSGHFERAAAVTKGLFHHRARVRLVGHLTGLWRVRLK
jgi:hypothetical protein